MAPDTQYLVSKRDGKQKTAYNVWEPQSNQAKRPLVLCQGMSAVGIIDWADLAEELSKTRTVVTFDNRDMGSSTWEVADASKSFTLEDLAQDVIELVEHLAYPEIDILGHSMGGMPFAGVQVTCSSTRYPGMIAQTVLTTPNLPFKIKHCILGATSAKNPKSDLGKAMAAEMKRQASNGDQTSKADRARALTETMMLHCYDPQWTRDREDLYRRRIQESLDSRRPAKTVALQQRAIGKYDLRAKLPSVPSSIPVLVIHGSQDLAVYYDEKEDILRGIRHARLLKMPKVDIGHNWYDYFEPGFWVAAIGDFLDDKPDRSSKL